MSCISNKKLNSLKKLVFPKENKCFINKNNLNENNEVILNNIDRNTSLLYNNEVLNNNTEYNKDNNTKSSNQLPIDNETFSKILIIYTGGTIGMMKTDLGYVPKKNFLVNFMYNHPNLCDKNYTKSKSSNKCIYEEFETEAIEKYKRVSIKKKTAFHIYRGNLNFSVYANKSNCLNKDLIFKVNPQLNNNNNKSNFSIAEVNNEETDFYTQIQDSAISNNKNKASEEVLSEKKFITSNSKNSSNFNLCYEVNEDNKFYSLPSCTLYTSKNHLNKRISYQILEFNEVIDSSNINVYYSNQIATCVSDFYNNYDGFVILHGTDTMSYSASMLSYMLENLSKPIIFTGSQIPLAEMSNDGLSNLINAISICGSYKVPEVCIMFSGKLLRGNRSIKNDNQGLNAFETPNLDPLMELGTRVKINKHIILNMPDKNQKFQMQKIKCININPFKYIPYISDEAIKSQLDSSNHEGIIIESYGAGNLPNNRAVLSKCLKDLMKTNVVVINVSQCRKGLMSTDYAVGKQLEALGIIYAGDLTFESAQAKLTYLMSKNYSKSEIKNLFSKSIRGELTEIKSDIDNNIDLQLSSKLKILLGSSQYSNENIDNIINKKLIPIIINKLVEEENINKLSEILNELGNLIIERNRLERISLYNYREKLNSNMFKNNVNSQQLNNYNSLINKTTPLHLSAKKGNINISKLLLKYGYDINALDEDNKSVLFYACLSQNEDLVNYFLKKDIYIHLKDIDSSILCNLTKVNNNKSIKLFYKAYQNIVFLKDFDKRNISHIAAIKNNIDLFKYFLSNVDYPFFRDKDIAGKSAYDYASKEIKDLIDNL